MGFLLITPQLIFIVLQGCKVVYLRFNPVTDDFVCCRDITAMNETVSKFSTHGVSTVVRCIEYGNACLKKDVNKI